MADDILERDADIRFPHCTVLKASAGSGKTHTLTKRFVQFILSEKIPRNKLRNILAVTFSNNAAKEMRERVLLWLKAVYLNDPAKISELSMITSLDKGQLIKKAGQLIDEILNNYSDFQVKTIDSFMTSVFKASALDFGYNPEFEILMKNDPVIDYAFGLFLRDLREGTEKAAYLEDIIASLLEHKKAASSYIWEPSALLLEEIKKLYRKLASTGKKPKVMDFSKDFSRLKDDMRSAMDELEELITASGLDRSGNSSYLNIRPIITEGRLGDLIGKGLKNPPVKKPKKAQADIQGSYNCVVAAWAELGALVRECISLYARSCYTPYLKAYSALSETIEAVKRRQGKIFIEDINKNLAEYLNEEIVPDVYFRMGEVIFHFLIDEFQDTSPIQWRNLLPLIENSLSQGGSLFAVGDTKQAVYGFRDADYTIMKELASANPFPSASHSVLELGTNHRSGRKILEFSEKVFKDVVANNETYKKAGSRSGLTDYVQKVREGREGQGHAEVVLLDKNDEEPLEKARLLDIITDLLSRDYRFGDIAVLTQKNDDAVRVSAWLNEGGIAFISYSSLDVRRRKITGEIVALLNFLDSPTDDLPFATFISGDIFTKTLARYSDKTDLKNLMEFLFIQRDNRPLYKAFQKEFTDLWEKYFEGIFRVSGYYPLYDLITEIFCVFRLFEIMEPEEAALIKMLEVVKEFEGSGFNSLKDFLRTAVEEDNGEAKWDMDVPKDFNAVKVMTTHKAKGLGFPAVILLLYEEHNMGFDYILEEEKDGVSLLKITKDIAECDPLLEELYTEEKIKEQVNKLNALYVGFTRPEEELYVVGVRTKKRGFPLDLLQPDSEAAHSKSIRPQPVNPASREDFAPLHFHKNIGFRAQPEKVAAIEERRRGELIHKAMSFVTYAGDDLEQELEDIMNRLVSESGAEYFDDGSRQILTGLIKDSELAGYFEERPGREIKNEQEFSDSNGNLFRMDRVVLDTDEITVIDYKTGGDEAEEGKYTGQLKTYMRILKEIYPERGIEGVLAYVDLGKIVRIGSLV